MDSLDKAPDGKLIVTLKYPHFYPVMKKCIVRSTRKSLEFAYNSRCKAENSGILHDLQKLRAKLAKILGYASHADFISETRMAKTSEKIHQFLNDLTAKVHACGRAASEMVSLKKMRLLETGTPESEPLEAFDLAFFRNLVMEREYAVDAVEIQQYFPFTLVTKGILEIYETLLSIKFEKDLSQPKWHEDVEAYRVVDANDGRVIGFFYMDMFPRDGKYSHAALFPLQPGCEFNGEKTAAVCSLVCNFTKPGNGKDSLLTHDEVVTYLHEFGHCMHHICAERPKFPGFSGTNVERDFVECPSQMLENWGWEPSILKKLSRHVETENCLPDDKLDALIKSRNADEGMMTLRQIALAKFDQTIHGKHGENCEPVETYAKVYEEVTGLRVTPGTAMPASFGHMCGYDAQYYGYLWAEVFSADCFVSKFRGNLLNGQVGKEYREKILGWGGSRDADEMIRDFLGREPRMDAFLELKGMI